MKDRELLSIFGEAIEIASQPDRAAFLAKACAGHAGARERVENLIAAHDAAGRFLGPDDEGDDELPELPRASSIWKAAKQPLLPGTDIGPYRVREQLGEGGMGTVYVAEQTHPVKRRVAIKVIKPGMDSKQVIARFEAERQALALMDHPNIARVIDAGTTDAGLPFFVMELVHGVPINVFCDNHELSIRERLTLFLQVCRAVQHAHLRGIIHRDLKPSNVLVAEIDDEFIAKVIDFGVAKATGQKLSEQTV
ncbi:MAG: serine/threonine protein kinase, partial [Planctomycetales bacterium]|nr:serine/threonine protein kinase [Planctomycetales bacterium]